jgi:hypothetical protein
MMSSGMFLFDTGGTEVWTLIRNVLCIISIMHMIYVHLTIQHANFVKDSASLMVKMSVHCYLTLIPNKVQYVSHLFVDFLSFLPSFGPGVWTQGFTHPRQMLYHLSHTPVLLYLSVSCFHISWLVFWFVLFLWDFLCLFLFWFLFSRCDHTM